MEWTNAIRKHAEMTGGKYRIPKKGSEEYDAVKALQMGGDAAAPKVKKAPKDVPVKTKKVVEVADKVKLLKDAKTAKAAKVPKEVTEGSVNAAPVNAAPVNAAPVKTKKLVQVTANHVEAEKVKLRKVRSDKGVKRGARKPKEEETVES